MADQTGRPLVARTLWAALAEAAGPDGSAESAMQEAMAAGAAIRPGDGEAADAPHPLAPPVGERASTAFLVGEDDTAAAMGHPDPTMTVVGSPRLGLWFELATSPLMPAREQGAAHVGVGLVVHHLGRAVVGESVEIEARVLAASGRGVVFALSALVGDRLVARGIHHRRILDRPPAPG